MVSATKPAPAVSDVLPGDEQAVNRVEGWFREYVATRDPVLREQIIVSYLGLADRLAERYRGSRGASPEDLRQTARVGLVAAAPLALIARTVLVAVLRLAAVLRLGVAAAFSGAFLTDRALV